MYRDPWKLLRGLRGTSYRGSTGVVSRQQSKRKRTSCCFAFFVRGIEAPLPSNPLVHRIHSQISDLFAQLLAQIRHRGEHAARNHVALDLGEPQLDLIGMVDRLAPGISKYRATTCFGTLDTMGGNRNNLMRQNTYFRYFTRAVA
jgi:hypothetical protein